MEKIDDKLVVFCHNIPQLRGEDFFNIEASSVISHTISPMTFLREYALSYGIKIISHDTFSNLAEKTPALLISHLWDNNSKKFFKENKKYLKKTILTCQESPYIATKFFLLLPFISAKFKHSFVFSGMKRWIIGRDNYRQMFFPQPYSENDFSPRPFGEKKFSVMVAGAKSVNNWKKDLFLKIMYGFGIKEIYSRRMDVARFFSGKNSIDIFGRGWESVSGINLSCYQGAVRDKFSVIKDYKFTFCFENSIMPGNVTEKIFDAIFAGSVPIYYGAPDITEYIPADVFIDFRKFNTMESLLDFLNEIDEAKYQSYIEAMRRFIRSDGYKKFNQEAFARDVTAILEDEFKKC